jgi:hypothetical protein
MEGTTKLLNWILIFIPLGNWKIYLESSTKCCFDRKSSLPYISKSNRMRILHLLP